MGVKAKVDDLRSVIVAFRKLRETLADLDQEKTQKQPQVIALMREVDPENNGIVVDEDDRSKGTAYVQQNQPSTVWDTERIMTWLKKPGRKGLWNSCSSRVLDIQKWEAEVANGNIPKTVARKMRTTTAPAQPYVRFGKRGDDSL